MSSVARMVMAHRQQGASRTDVRNPCAICGWGPHMGIHQGPHGIKTFDGAGFLHAYEPASANRIAPTSAATVSA